MKNRDFDLKQAEVFCYVAQYGSFSQAAGAMSLTQPTASAHIANLEKSLGIKLLERKGKTTVVTPAGKVFYEYVLKLLSIKREAVEEVQRFTGKISGTLAIGGSTIPGTYLLPRFIGEFAEKYKEVEVNLTINDTQEIIGLVKRGTLELGVVGAYPPDRTFDTEPFWHDEVVLVVPARHHWIKERVRPFLKDVLAEPFILRESGSGTRQLIEDVLKNKGLSPKLLSVAARLGSTEAVKQGIIAGMGISLVSKKAVEHEEKLGLLKTVTIEDVTFARYFYVVTHTVRTKSPACLAFISFLLSKSNIQDPEL